MLVFFGTYTRSSSLGIYAARFDPTSGELSKPWLAAEAHKPTFLALHPDRRHMCATGERPGNPPAGGIGAFEIVADAGLLKLMNFQATGGAGTTHVAVDATGRTVLAANYASGYVCALPIGEGGALGSPCAKIEHRGPLGPNAQRQDKPHAHCVAVSPDNRFVLSCDLGLDRVFVYRLDPASAGLAPNDPPFAAALPGSGPRHGKFSADGRFFYVSNEMGGSVSVFGWDTAHGALSLKQTVSTLPSDFRGENNVGEIALHPGGRFVYASNRGHESIAAFACECENGTLASVGLFPCGGRHPRHFAFEPGGRWLLCANRDTDNVTVFSVDPSTGSLSPSRREITVPEPVCVLPIA